MAELTATEVMMDYVKEIRYHLESGDNDTASVILQLLEDMIDPTWELHSIPDDDNDDEVDDGDIFDPDIVNDHCDYCGSDGMETFGLPDSDFAACNSCLGTHFELVK